MDPSRFDELARGLSRRGLLRGLSGGGLALTGWQLAPYDVEAKKKRRKKRKKRRKPVFNTFGCLDVGQPCRGDDTLCCSGICKGNKPKQGEQDQRKCVAHNAGICTVQSDICLMGMEVFCHPTNPLSPCFCLLTTGNAPFCGDASAAVNAGDDIRAYCRGCQRDSDCEPEFGPGAGCVFLGGVCASLCATRNGSACLPPCA